MWGLKDGHTVILGGYGGGGESDSERGESRADEIGTDAFDGMYNKAYLPTTSKERATALIKHKMFEESHNLSFSLQRVGHKVPADSNIETEDEDES